MLKSSGCGIAKSRITDLADGQGCRAMLRSAVGSALGARLTPTSPTGELPWYARPANEVAGEIGQQIGAVVADTLGPLASFAERLNPVSISNVYNNIQGGARELEDTRRVSDQANMRVVRELQP